MKGGRRNLYRPIPAVAAPCGITWAHFVIILLSATAHRRVGAQPGTELQNNSYGYLANFNSSMAIVIVVKNNKQSTCPLPPSFSTAPPSNQNPVTFLQQGKKTIKQTKRQVASGISKRKKAMYRQILRGEKKQELSEKYFSCIITSMLFSMLFKVPNIVWIKIKNTGRLFNFFFFYFQHFIFCFDDIDRCGWTVEDRDRCGEKVLGHSLCGLLWH